MYQCAPPGGRDSGPRAVAPSSRRSGSSMSSSGYRSCSSVPRPWNRTRAPSGSLSAGRMRSAKLIVQATTLAMTTTPVTTKLLGPDELAAWRGLLRVHASLTKALDSELVRAHDLPLSSYEVLLFL